MSTGGKSGGVPALVPPLNFAMVEGGIYRSAYPTESNVMYLRRIGITHVVLLSIEQLPGPVRRLLGSEVTGKASSGCLTRGPIRIVEFMSMQSWRVDGGNDGDDFSSRDVVRALDVAVDRRWHPVLFACPLGELQTSLVVGCMRRYQHWALASIFSECELFSSVCRNVRDSILSFIQQWDPATHPISAVDIQHRNRERRKHARDYAHQAQRRLRSSISLRSSKGAVTSSDPDGDGDYNENGETGVATAGHSDDAQGKSEEDRRDDNSLPPLAELASSEAGLRPSGGESFEESKPDSALFSSSGQRPSAAVRHPSSRLGGPQDSLSGSLGDEIEDLSPYAQQILEGRKVGIEWAEWYLDSLRIGDDLLSRAYLPPSAHSAEKDGWAGDTALPPPHALYANVRNPPAIDARSVFTKESIVEEDDD